MSRKTIQSNSEILQTNPLNWILLCGLELINVILLDWSSSHKATCFQTQGAEQQYENKQHALSYVRWVKRNTVHKDTTHNSFRPTPKRIHIFHYSLQQIKKKERRPETFFPVPCSVCADRAGGKLWHFEGITYVTTTTQQQDFPKHADELLWQSNLSSRAVCSMWSEH